VLLQKVKKEQHHLRHQKNAEAKSLAHKALDRLSPRYSLCGTNEDGKDAEESTQTNMIIHITKVIHELDYAVSK